jgi:hypothetical protein
MSVIIFKTFYHAINTQDEYIKLSRLIDLLIWAPTCLVYSSCHNSALNYNIYLLNSSKVKKICINRNYYDLYVLSARFSNKNLVIKEKISGGSGYTFYRP